MPQPLTWSVAEVCRHLGISRTTLWKLRRREVDPLPTIHVGRSVRFDRAAVLAWLERESRRSTPPS